MRLYVSERTGRWEIEENDGTIREATPEELETAIGQWEQEAREADNAVQCGSDIPIDPSCPDPIRGDDLLA